MSKITTILAWFLSFPLAGAPTLVKTIPLGTQPPLTQPVTGALAQANHRLYIFNGPWNAFGQSNVPTPMVAIVDTATDTLVGRIRPSLPSGMNLVETTTQRNCVFTNPATNKVYAAYSGGGSGMIVVIDSATDTIVQTVAVAGGISNMAFNPANNKIYVAQVSAANPTQLLAFDITTMSQIASIGGVDNGSTAQIVGPPLAINPANNRVYTASANSGILVIDSASDTVRANIGVAANITEIQIDAANGRAYAGFSASDQTMYVIDGSTDSLFTTVTTTSLFGAITVDPIRNIIYSPMGSSFQIDGTTNTVQTGPVYGNFSPPVNADCAIIFPAAPDFSLHNWYGGCDGEFLVADSITGSYKNAIPVNYVTLWGKGVVDPISHKTYNISPFNNSVTAFDPSTLTATLIQLGNLPIGVAANAVTNRVYVADGPSNAAVVVDGSTNNVLAKVFAKTSHPGRAATLANGIAVNSATNKYMFLEQATGVQLDGATNNTTVYIDPGFKGNGTPNPYGFNFAAVNTVTNMMYTADRNTIYATNLSPGSFTTLVGVTCNIGGLAVGEANNSVYVTESCQGGGRIEVFDGTSGALLKSADVSPFIPAAATAGAAVLNPKTGKLYVVGNGAASTAEVFNAVTLGHIATVANVGGTLAVNTVLNAIYGTNTGAGGGVAVIDGNSDTLSSTFGSGIVVSGLAANEATNMLYVGDSGQGTVAVFQGDTPTAGTFSISGKVVSGAGVGVPGITVTSTGAVKTSTVTDANGLFTLMGIQTGGYTIAPASAGYFYGPASQSVSVTTTSITGVNFVALTTPIAVTSLTLAPWTTIGPGVTTNGTVTLNQPAPPGGVVINLSASNTKPARVPATVTVPAGSTTATFAIQGNSVGAVTPTTITATYQGSFASQPSSAGVALTVSPTDSLKIQSATWSRSTQILSVTATSTNPQSILQLFLASNNQLLGTFDSQGNANYSIQVPFTSGTPASVNVKSNLGGSTGQGVTVLP